MFAHDLHLTLALASLAVMALVAVEGAVRLVAARSPGRLAAAGSGSVTILVAMTSAGGLALLVGGQRPTEWLHLIYALLAFGLVPLADSLVTQASPRRQALARLLGALVAAVVNPPAIRHRLNTPHRPPGRPRADSYPMLHHLDRLSYRLTRGRHKTLELAGPSPS